MPLIYGKPVREKSMMKLLLYTLLFFYLTASSLVPVRAEISDPAATAAPSPTATAAPETALDLEGEEVPAAEESPVQEEEKEETTDPFSEGPVAVQGPAPPGLVPSRGPALPALPYQVNLTTEGTLASYPNPNKPGKYRFLTYLTLDGRPAYCLTPGIDTGISYTGDGIPLPGEKHLRAKRIAFFGFGHPLTGTSWDAYIATQLLIWREVEAPLYSHIKATYQKCDGLIPGLHACSLGQDGVDAQMDAIMNLVDNYDKVPSFANAWHGTAAYELDWDETLVLTDSHGVMDWFETEPAESHQGINLKVEGSSLKIDIDDLYYEGWDSPGGKRLTFRRRAEQWNEMMSGIVVYTSGVSQQLLAESGVDPSPSYSLSFSLKRGNVSIQKTDEYGSVLAGQTASYYLGWKEDPLQQYSLGGGGDLSWSDRHDPSRTVKHDLDGTGRSSGALQVYYPLMEADGKTPRIFSTDSSGHLLIQNLPADRSWWLKEISSSQAFEPSGRSYLVQTGSAGSTSFYAFGNHLRDLELELMKQDEENTEIKINGARLRIYENDLTAYPRQEVPLGTEIGTSPEDFPDLAYEDLQAYGALAAGDSFCRGGWRYTVKGEKDNKILVAAVKEKTGETQRPLSRYPFAKAQVEQTISLPAVLCMNGTWEKEDDTVRHRSFAVVEKKDNLLTLREEGMQTHMLIRDDTVPSLAAFQAAAERQGVSLSTGSQVLLEDVYYRIVRTGDEDLIVVPQRQRIVDLADPAPVYEDLPAIGSLHVGDTFSLSFQEEEISFEVAGKSAETMTVKSGEETYVINLPAWLEEEQVPEELDEQQHFSVVRIQPPVYEVQDDRGNIYRVKKTGTEVLTRASEKDSAQTALDGQAADLSFAELTASAGSYDPLGLAAGHTFVKTLSEEETISFDPLSWEEISQEEKAAGILTRGERTFQILQQKEEQMELSYVVEGKAYLFTLEPGTSAGQAVYRRERPVTFTVMHREEKEIDLAWDTIAPGRNSQAANPNLHLFAWADPQSAETLCWKDVRDADHTAGSTFTDGNGETYEMLYFDETRQLGVVQSRKGRYEVTPHGARSVLPITFEDYVTMERERGADFQEGDGLEKMYARPLASGDVFTCGSHAYIVTGLSYIRDRESATLRRNPFYEKEFLTALEEDAPFSPADLYQLWTAGKPLVQAGRTYQISHPEKDSSLLCLQAEGGPVYTYARIRLQDETRQGTLEETSTYDLEVEKPERPSWKDLQAARYGPKTGGQHILLKEVMYEIVKFEDTDQGRQVTLLEEGKQEPVVYLEGEEGYHAVMEAPLELREGDVLNIEGMLYAILETGTGSQGAFVRLRALKKGDLAVVHEHPDPSLAALDHLYFWRTGVAYNLKEIFPKVSGYRLRTAYAGVHLEEDILTSEKNHHVVLQLLDAAGLVMGEKEIIFSRQEAVGEKDLLPLFEGITGSWYLRLVDERRHNAPLRYKEITLYGNENLTDPRTVVTTDAFGTAEVKLAAGTYWYQHPLTLETIFLEIPEESYRQGILNVPALQWGRTYTACEMDLPEGYEYGDQEVCHTFTLQADRDISRVQVQLENRRRRLEVQVIKVDQEDHSLLLDNARFSLRDITDEEKAGTYSQHPQRVTMQNIPSGARAGDLVPVWPALSNGPRSTYRIEHVEENQVVLSRLESSTFKGVYPIPKYGVGAEAPLLYQDVAAACGTIKEGRVFSAIDKQPRDTLRLYRLCTVETAPGTDLFGQPVPEETISRVVLEEVGTAAAPIEIFRLKANDSPGGEDLGRYLSGGLIIEKRENVPSVPVTFEEVLIQCGGKPAPGQTVHGMVRHTVLMPSYEEAVQALAEGKTLLEKEGAAWSLKAQGSGVEASFQGQTFRLAEDIVSGAVSWMEEEALNIEGLEEEEGILKGIRLRAQSSSWYVEKGEAQQETVAGQPGVYVEVKEKGSGRVVFRGYTGLDGTVLLRELPAGVYLVSSQGEEVEREVLRGGFAVNEIIYGHTIEICEIQSPLGYVIGNACTILRPSAPVSTDLVKNYRPNTRLRRRITVVHKRRMGDLHAAGN